MGKSNRRGNQRTFSGARLLVLPVLLLTALFGFVMSFRPVRRATFALLSGLVLFAIEAIVLAGLWGKSHRTAFQASLAIAYGSSLATLGYAWWRFRGRRRLRVRRFESLLALTPTGFEIEVGRLLHDIGYRNVEHLGGAGDLTADLRCRDKSGQPVVVQCKRYAPGRRVGSADLQAFIGMMTIHHEAQRGIFVTTAEFTAPATELAGLHCVRLMDGPLLSRMITDLRGSEEPETRSEERSFDRS